ncbi:Zinc finger protein plag1 [Chytriomyces hyalinus]|nr:Zinc finger protein plag1 [Chytriomyces hyalinus]
MPEHTYEFENWNVLQDLMFDSNSASSMDPFEVEFLHQFRLEFTYADDVAVTDAFCYTTKPKKYASDTAEPVGMQEFWWTGPDVCVAPIDRPSRSSNNIQVEKATSDTEFASKPTPTTTTLLQMDLLTLVNQDSLPHEYGSDIDTVPVNICASAYSPTDSTSSEWTTPLQTPNLGVNRDAQQQQQQQLPLTLDKNPFSIYSAAPPSPATPHPSMAASTESFLTESISPISTTTTPPTTTAAPPKQRARPRHSPYSASSSSTTTDTRPREHECTVCHNRFLRRQDLSRHLVTHSKTKNFACQFDCGSSFGRSDALARHMKTGKCSSKSTGGGSGRISGDGGAS